MGNPQPNTNAYKKKLQATKLRKQKLRFGGFLKKEKGRLLAQTLLASARAEHALKFQALQKEFDTLTFKKNQYYRDNKKLAGHIVSSTQQVQELSREVSDLKAQLLEFEQRTSASTKNYVLRGPSLVGGGCFGGGSKHTLGLELSLGWRGSGKGGHAEHLTAAGAAASEALTK